ncbi:hypothetical protein NDU88_010509 [Pleurodeles waltl]|uniref:Uncharacterized protein n=1 Tax=Pleurodeles waltl TaxID=8319 RepID=A0AAV7PYK4_PLEWA|nr:hypothetical protein NDU88_010509 [Pleurodeles waltl]
MGLPRRHAPTSLSGPTAGVRGCLHNEDGGRSFFAGVGSLAAPRLGPMQVLASRGCPERVPPPNVDPAGAPFSRGESKTGRLPAEDGHRGSTMKPAPRQSRLPAARPHPAPLL